MKITDLSEFFVLDTETTGYKPEEGADAIEVSALKVKVTDKGAYEIIDTFDSYINPKYPLPPDTVEFNKLNHTGINDELLSKAPTAAEVTVNLSKFLGNKPVLVGHNISFDIGFINKLYNKCFFMDFKPKDTVDTLELSRKHIKGKKHRLGDMHSLTDKRYSPEAPKFHTSIADCYATLDVLAYIKEEYYSGKVKPKEEELEIIKPKLTDDEQLRRKIEEELYSRFDSLSNAIPYAFLIHKEIKSIALGIDLNGKVNTGDSKVSLEGDTTDLTQYIYNSLSEGRSALHILATKSAENEKIYLTFYNAKGKNVNRSISEEISINEEYLMNDGLIDCLSVLNSCFNKTIESARQYDSKRSGR